MKLFLYGLLIAIAAFDNSNRLAAQDESAELATPRFGETASPASGILLSDALENKRIRVLGLAGKSDTNGDMLYAFIHLASRTDVRKSLEILNSQIGELKGLGRFQRSEFDELTKQYFRERNLGNPTHDEKETATKSILTRKYMESLEEIKSVLLPHQMESLNELAFIAVRDRVGKIGLIQSYWGKSELELTDDQMERVIDRHKREQAELKRKIAELKKKAKEAVLEELTLVQREKLKAFVTKVDSKLADVANARNSKKNRTTND